MLVNVNPKRNVKGTLPRSYISSNFNTALFIGSKAKKEFTGNAKRLFKIFCLNSVPNSLEF